MKRILFILQALAGGALIFIGGFVLKGESIRMISGLCIGTGAAALALGLGWFVQSIIINAVETESIGKQKEIEIKDERNVRIREKSGYMVAKSMNYLLTAFILTLGFMNADKKIIIMAVILMSIQFILLIYFSNYYSKRL